MKNDIHDLGLVLDSRVRLIVIESWDEPRVLETLSGLAIKRGLGLYLWSVTEGVQRLGFGGEPQGGDDSREPEVALRLVKADPQANLYVFCDLHPFLADSPRLVRLLKEVAMAQGSQRPTLVLVSHALKLPAELQRLTARFSLALPGEDELLAIVRDEAQRWSERNHGLRVRADNRTLQQLVKNLRGLAHAEARLLARNVICNDGAITQDDLPELNARASNCSTWMACSASSTRLRASPMSADWAISSAGSASGVRRSSPPRVPTGRAACCWSACRAVAKAWRPRRWPACGACRCCVWTSPACTTSTSARPSATCARR